MENAIGFRGWQDVSLRWGRNPTLGSRVGTLNSRPWRSSCGGTVEMNLTRNHEVRSLASLSGLRVWRCRELWCRSQMQLRSCMAVAVVQASSGSSD